MVFVETFSGKNTICSLSYSVMLDIVFCRINHINPTDGDTDAFLMQQAHEEYFPWFGRKQLPHLDSGRSIYGPSGSVLRQRFESRVIGVGFSALTL